MSNLKKLSETKLANYFNTYIRDKWWNKNSKMKKQIITTAESLILTLQYYKDNPQLISDRDIAKTRAAAGNYFEIPSKIITEAAYNSEFSEITKDGIIGNRLIGDTIIQEWEVGNITLLNVEDWVYEHLWIYSQCTVTKEEHKSKNILRQNNGNLTLEDKALFRHYVNTSEILFLHD